jgi:hypothetical protein
LFENYVGSLPILTINKIAESNLNEINKQTFMQPVALLLQGGKGCRKAFDAFFVNCHLLLLWKIK